MFASFTQRSKAMKDKSLSLGDLKFIARKREFWASLALVAAIGFGLGVLV